MKRSRAIVLLLTFLLPTAASLAAPPKPCTLEKWTGVARPTGKSYGPDNNEALIPDYAQKLTIPRGRTASFEFWTHGPESENAVVLYDGKFNYITKRKMAGGRDYSSLTIKGPEIVIFSGWHKDGAGAWAGNYTKAEVYPRVANMWIAGSEDTNAQGDYRDFAATIVCK